MDAAAEVGLQRADERDTAIADRMSLFMEDRKEKLGPSEPLAVFTKAHHKPSWSFLMSAH